MLTLNKSTSDYLATTTTAMIKCDKLLASIESITNSEQQIQHKPAEERKSKWIKGIEKHNRLVELSRKKGST